MLRRRGIDAEQAAGNVDGLLQFTAKRHVHAVIVERREVNRRERAAFESARPGLCGEQLRQSVVATLGLQEAVTVDRARFADAAVDGTRDRRLVARNRACALLEGAGKELVEAAIAVGIAFGGLRHVDAVELEKPAYGPILEPCGAHPGRRQYQP